MSYYLHQRRSVNPKKKHWRVIIYGGILTLTGLFIIIYFSPVFKLTQVNVTGQTTLASSVIQSFVQENFVYHGSHSLFLPLSSLEQKTLKYFPALDKVKIKRHFPHTLTVNLEERDPFLKINFQKIVFYADRSGFLFQPKSSKKQLPQLEINSQNFSAVKVGTFILPPKTWERLYQIISYFEKRQKILPFSEAQLSSPQRLNVILKSGPALYFDLNKDPQQEFKELEALLHQSNFWNLEYIDFRFPNRVYLK